jgi:Multiubiquitin
MSNEHGGHVDAIAIIVNGRPREAQGHELTFDQVVALAFDNPPYGADTIFSITYRKGGNEHRPEGVMVEGDTVKVKKGTIFNVSATNRS